MDKLKKKIIRYFLICALAIPVLDALSNEFFDSVMERTLSSGAADAPHIPSVVLIFVATILVSLLILAASATVFYCLVRKAVEAESKRQAAEQNMLYSCIAHDLKTPMTSIQGFAAALRDGRIKDEELGEVCDIICLKTRYMNELVDTLSAYSKLGTENYTLNLQETDLCVLVRDTAAMYYSDFESKGIEMIADIPDEPLLCRLDKKEFTRAVGNVIINAFRHNPSGCRVLIKVHSVNGQPSITIADTGDRISQELVPTLFEPFVSGNASRTSGTGSGLGLAVSKRIAEKHGMTLSYSTEIPGYSKGFVFLTAAR